MKHFNRVLLNIKAKNTKKPLSREELRSILEYWQNKGGIIQRETRVAGAGSVKPC